jgi:RNA-directed DNA polymerase
MLTKKQIGILTEGMAAALLAGPWKSEAMISRLADALGQKWRWRHGLIRTLLTDYTTPPSYSVLKQAIANSRHFQKAINNKTRPHIVHWHPLPSAMSPRFPDWNLPAINTSKGLEDRLALQGTKLEWLADCEYRQGHRNDPRRRHYRFYWLRKPSGGWRLVEEPLYLLKSVQRRILGEILNNIVPHPAACAFRSSRSIVDYAAAHVGQEVVLHLDLKNFFPSIPASRVHAMFTTLGYPDEVARLITGLCTSTVPFRIYHQKPGGQSYSTPHLPQGAPTSPALANLAAFHLDCRLSAAASSVGAAYTRYADDLAFSGGPEFRRSLQRFQTLVWQIVADEGFEINHRKTRVMHKSVRQRLCGLVVNKHTNIDRRTYDQLKAILTNCSRHGLASQNRENHPNFRAHLGGRITHVEHINPTRGGKLRALLDLIPHGDDSS